MNEKFAISLKKILTNSKITDLKIFMYYNYGVRDIEIRDREFWINVNIIL